jgi:hypothetical protein
MCDDEDRRRALAEWLRSLRDRRAADAPVVDLGDDEPLGFYCPGCCEPSKACVCGGGG